MNKLLCQLDAVVPFAPILRRTVHVGTGGLWPAILLRALPLTGLFLWIAAQWPLFGILVYALLLVPLAAWHHITANGITGLADRAGVLLWYFAVILTGAGALWLFVAGLAGVAPLRPEALILGLAGLATIRYRSFAPIVIIAQLAVWSALIVTSGEKLLLVLMPVLTATLLATLLKPRGAP